MTGQFEYTEHADKTNDAKDGQGHGLVAGLCLVGHDCTQSYEVRNDCNDVDDVHNVSEESEVIRRGGKPDEQLGRKPYNAGRLDDKERLLLKYLL